MQYKVWFEHNRLHKNKKNTRIALFVFNSIIKYANSSYELWSNTIYCIIISWMNLRSAVCGADSCSGMFVHYRQRKDGVFDSSCLFILFMIRNNGRSQACTHNKGKKRNKLQRHRVVFLSSAFRFLPLLFLSRLAFTLWNVIRLSACQRCYSFLVRRSRRGAFD